MHDRITPVMIRETARWSQSDDDLRDTLRLAAAALEDSLSFEVSLKEHSDCRLVIVESPFAGDITANVAYARAAMRDCFMRGEAPYASHLLFTQEGILDDTNPAERRQGIEAGLLWGRNAHATVVYTDRGISSGMQQGIARATSLGRPVEYRTLPEYGDAT